MNLAEIIRTIPDYPKPGIMFRDITTLLGDARAFRRAVDELVQPFAGMKIDKVAGIEARGFILGGAVAHQLSAGFVPLRKKGKLPHKTRTVEYALEYGTDSMEMHLDAVKAGERVMLVDDLIATGGTALAAVHLLREAGADIVAAAFVVDLPELGGAAQAEGGRRAGLDPGGVRRPLSHTIGPSIAPSGRQSYDDEGHGPLADVPPHAVLGVVAAACLIYAGAVVHAWRVLPGAPKLKLEGMLLFPALYFLASLAAIPLLTPPLRNALSKHLWISFRTGFGQSVISVLAVVFVLATAAAFIYWRHLPSAALSGQLSGGLFSAYAAGVGVLLAQALLVRRIERDPALRPQIEGAA